MEHSFKSTILKDWEKGYLAGFLDADGSFTIVNGDHPRLRINVYQKERAVLDRMREMVDGLGAITDKVGSGLKRGSNGHMWQMHAKAAGLLSKTIGPFMLKKGPQAKIAVLFSHTVTGNKAGPQIISLRKRLREEMLKLNASGKRRDVKANSND